MNMNTNEMPWNPRRARYTDITKLPAKETFTPDAKLLEALEKSDLIYRALCAILFNFVPNSGHPGGSISSGRIVQSLLFHTMDYDIASPNRADMDLLCYAAGHKAMGLYAAWALRNELVRVSRPTMLPAEKLQLRLEDLLGFRRNPTATTKLFVEHRAKALDGHPTPATPFVRLATGASGVGMGASVGLALAAADTYGLASSPIIQVLEGEGGMTPGRVSEALATAASAQLNNLVLHVDWNQSSIDSNQVCREGAKPGDYVQWSPAELCFVNDWNVVAVPNGHDFTQVLAAQTFAAHSRNSQPTAIVYRTVKGWKYGIEGRSAHGAGHAFCSEGFYTACADFEKTFGTKLQRFAGEKNENAIERCFFDCLLAVRSTIEKNRAMADTLADGLANARERLDGKRRSPRKDVPRVGEIYSSKTNEAPQETMFKPGQAIALRGALGEVLSVLNKKSGGAIIGSSADLFDSTSLSALAKSFPAGLYNAATNAGSRLVATGGICEDTMGAVLSGLATFGNHIGVGSSYGAFIAALQHVPARLHAIGQQAKGAVTDPAKNPFLIVCAHAGPKTGEDGPTHADPQALQLLQENFPRGSMITLTPWDANELWPLVVAALKHRPAVIAPFVTRPAEPVVDRSKFNIAPAHDAITGVYALRRATGTGAGTVVLQGNGVASAFITEVLPELDRRKLDMNVYYVASAELFDLLSESERQRIFPEAHAREAIGITEFTIPTMYRWITSEEGRRRTLHPFSHGHYLGSGAGLKVLEEAGIDGKSQLKAILECFS